MPSFTIERPCNIQFVNSFYLLHQKYICYSRLRLFNIQFWNPPGCKSPLVNILVKVYKLKEISVIENQECETCMKQTYMSVNFKKTNKIQQLEIVPTIQRNLVSTVTNWSIFQESIKESRKSITTGVTGKSKVQRNQEENCKELIYVEVFQR